MGTITKALELLELFSDSRTDLSLAEFVEATGRDKATVHRHLAELESNGYLERNSLTRDYRLGSAITRLAKVRELSYPIKAIVRPLLIDLATDLGELVHFSVLDDERLKTLVYFDPGIKATRINFDDREKESLPLHATASGIAMLAFSPPALLNSVINQGLERFTEHTLVDESSLISVIERARDNGISRSEQAFDNEVTSHGCVVFDGSGYPVGAISVAVPVSRLDTQMTRQIRQGLFKITSEITRRLGGEIPKRYQKLWENGCNNSFNNTKDNGEKRRCSDLRN